MAENTEHAEEVARPTIVCNGWGLSHPEIVVVPGDPGLPKSHGMCERCQLFMDAAIDVGAGSTINLEQYRAYLESPIDPRD